MDSYSASIRIALIGAGPSGLDFMRSFSVASKKLGEHQIPDIVCFDKQSEWGGQWNMTWRTGLDEYGEPVHSGMYPHLWINAPKEVYEYADYTWDEHFGRPSPSYVEREQLRDYLLARAKKSGIRNWIRFNHVVRYVEHDTQKSMFTVRTQDLVTGKENWEQFDYVVVATGHFSYPNVPYVGGIEQFPGRIIHSHDFRNAEEFSGQNLLIVGSNFSAEDIALQTYKFGAKSITISYRSRKFGFKWPANIKEVPLWSGIQGKTVEFQDGTRGNFDSIIICTGYRHHFPFLPENLRLVATNRPYPANLYKGIFFQDQPNLLYLCMQNNIYTPILSSVQAEYACEVILGRIKLPDPDERKNDIENWLSKEPNNHDYLGCIQFQVDYIKDLLSKIDFLPVDIDGLAAIMHEYVAHKNEDILNYRNKTHRSVFTGTMAEPRLIPWILCDKKEEINS